MLYLKQVTALAVYKLLNSPVIFPDTLLKQVYYEKITASTGNRIYGSFFL